MAPAAEQAPTGSGDNDAPPAVPNGDGEGSGEAEGPRPTRGVAVSPMGFQPPEGVGTIAVTLTDAPGDFQAVPVTIAEVRIHRVGEPSTETGDSGGDDGEWLVLVDSPSTWDLLTLQNGVTALLGQAEVAAETYDQIQLVVSEASVVVDGVEFPLTIPSGSQTGLKLHHDFDVTRDVEHELRLDFDAAASIHLTPQGYRLVPVIDVDYFGPIGGGEG